MKLGIVLPSWFYNQERRAFADAAFKSLANSKPLSEQTNLLIIAKEGTVGDYLQYVPALEQSFHVEIINDTGLHGTEQTLAYGTTKLFDEDGMNFVTWMGDDALFHSEWLLQLEALIQRHPDAVIWSVYRSNHERFHAPLEFIGEDVRVRSICGHGFTMSKEEWAAWGIDWHRGAWAGGGGDTLDLVHSEFRQGERWVTRKSYIQHTGWRHGVHCTGVEKEYAQEFQCDGVS